MKTPIVKKILTLLGLVMVVVHLSAQTDSSGRKQMSDELMKNSYIFEGKVISIHRYTHKINEEEYKIYTSYIVEVKKVVKGNIQRGTINILIPDVHISDGQIIMPKEGLYFCYTDSPVKDSSVTNTNSKSLEYYCGESMEKGELKKDSDDNLINYFSSIADFYAYISANYGVTIK